MFVSSALETALAKLPAVDCWTQAEFRHGRYARSRDLEVARRQASEAPRWSVDVGPVKTLVSSQEAAALKQFCIQRGIQGTDEFGRRLQ